MSSVSTEIGRLVDQAREEGRTGGMAEERNRKLGVEGIILLYSTFADSLGAAAGRIGSVNPEATEFLRGMAQQFGAEAQRLQAAPAEAQEPTTAARTTRKRK